MMRPIDASKFTAVPISADFGPASQLQWLPIASLVVDDDYQRPVAGQGEKTIKTIIAKFDWRLFAPVVVSPVLGGLYAIVDGQHRTTAAAACGHALVPCAIILADRKQQAIAFGAINGVVTQVSRHQQFKAAIAAGDEGALRIAAVTKQAGVRVLFSNKTAAQLKPGETLALRAIERGIAKHGDVATVAALKGVMASAGDLCGYLRGSIITAVVDVVADHPEWASDKRLDEAFRLIDLEDAWREASAAAAKRKGVLAQDVLQAVIVTHLDLHLQPAKTGKMMAPERAMTGVAVANLSDFQRGLARHARGLPNASKTANRNHYVTGPSPEFDAWMAMVGYGFAKTKAGNELTGGDQLFWLTYQGAAAALADGEGLDPAKRYPFAEVARG